MKVGAKLFTFLWRFSKKVQTAKFEHSPCKTNVQYDCEKTLAFIGLTSNATGLHEFFPTNLTASCEGPVKIRIFP